MPLPWYWPSLRSVHALRHQNTGKAAYTACSGSVWEGKREGFVLPSFQAELCITSVHHKRNFSLSSLLPQTPFCRENPRKHLGLLPLVLSLASAKSTFLQRLQTQWPSPELWGQGRELGSEHGRPLAVLGERPCSTAVPALVSAGSRTPCEHLGKPSMLAAAAPHKRYNRKDNITSCFSLSQGDFFALLQLYPPGNADFF